jgi:hypothetical protein
MPRPEDYLEPVAQRGASKSDAGGSKSAQVKTFFKTRNLDESIEAIFSLTYLGMKPGSWVNSLEFRYEV